MTVTEYKEAAKQARKDYFRKLTEGTWHCPYSQNEAQAILALLKHPISAEDAEHLMYNLYGDDKLFDSFYDAKDPADVRPEIIRGIRELLKDIRNGNRFTDWDGTKVIDVTWKPEVIATLRKISRYKLNNTPDTTEPLKEASGRKSRYSLGDVSGDVSNPDVEIYSPTLEKYLGISSVGSAAETANYKPITDKLVSQGNRKTDLDRSPNSIARNIFAAALGTEHINDPDVRMDAEDLKVANKGDLRLRNTAYAIIDPKTGEQINVEWDFIDPEALDPDNQAKYYSVNRNYRDDELMVRRKADVVKNREEAQAEFIKNLSNDAKKKIDVTQDPQKRLEFLRLLKDWDYYKSEQTKGIELVVDRLPSPYSMAVLHIEGKNNSLTEKNFLAWADNRLDHYKAISVKKEKIQKALDYYKANKALWDEKIMQRLCKSNNRRKISLAQYLKDYGSKL